MKKTAPRKPAAAPKVIFDNSFVIDEHTPPPRVIVPGTEYVVLASIEPEGNDTGTVALTDVTTELEYCKAVLENHKDDYKDKLAFILRIHRTAKGQFVLSIVS